MASETTQGHAAWLTIGAGAMLTGAGVLLTVALASAPHRGWHWVGVSMIVIGALIVATALAHQFRHKLLGLTGFSTRRKGGQLAGLLGSLETVILAIKQTQAMVMQPGISGLEAAREVEKTGSLFSAWLPRAVEWIRQNEPGAEWLFAKCADVEGDSMLSKNLALALCYRDNLDTLYVELTGRSFRAPMSPAAPEAFDLGLSITGPLLWMSRPFPLGGGAYVVAPHVELVNRMERPCTVGLAWKLLARDGLKDIRPLLEIPAEIVDAASDQHVLGIGAPLTFPLRILGRDAVGGALAFFLPVPIQARVVPTPSEGDPDNFRLEVRDMVTGATRTHRVSRPYEEWRILLDRRGLQR